MATTKLILTTGDELVVDASLDEVVKELENAARSSVGTLARLKQAGTGERLAVNGAQVVAVQPLDPAASSDEPERGRQANLGSG
jgi:hypothetical protein